ncbi:MAG: hypothetical protein C4527_20210 [Candidatus Omnitrophota bacterium]|jgi:flagellar capping protein FliD|nr:MAG: hypothetical protein C4527_20210 [Candidatus Omnitrophota bacterium]
MSNLAIEGLISGFNTTELINAILDIQVRAPVAQYEKRIQEQTQKLTAYQSLNANVLSLEITAQSLNSSALFQGKEAKSSNESVVTASASNSASLGSFSVRVDNLAQVDQLSSDLFASSTDELGLNGKFIINGKTISISSTDTLNTIATQINGSNAGVKASVIQTAPNQNKLVIGATSAGVDRIEMREVGSSGILSSLGLVDNSVKTYDYTVNATTYGAQGNLFDPTDTFGAAGQSFSITDAGGQHTLNVSLTGARTLSELAGDINAASTAQGANIRASVITEGAQQRLQITSDTGIPTTFTDPDNVLFSTGILSGVQSEEFTSSVLKIGSLLNLGATTTSTITITDGDLSDSINVDIDLDSQSLTDIANAINTAAGAAGSDISAQVITVGSNSRLEIKSASGHPVFSADPNNVLNTLGIVDSSFKHHDQRGENAQITFNGVTVNRSSNLITDLVDGVSLALVSESSTAAMISITEDFSKVESVIQDFVSAYNNVIELINEHTAFNPQKDIKGVLFGDSTLRQLKSMMANMISRTVPNLPGVNVSELNDGKGIDFGSIKITDRSGKSATIDLSQVETVQDVLDAINLNTDVKVKAEINVAGTSINLIDSSGGTGALTVEDVDGNTTATDLGLKAYIYGNRHAGAIIYAGGSSALSSIGISLNTKGTLSFNASELLSALNSNPDSVKTLLTAETVGFASVFRQNLKLYTAYNTGLLDSSTKAIQNKMELFNNQIERYEKRASIYEETLRKKFTALEVAMSKSQQLSDYLTQNLTTKK